MAEATFQPKGLPILQAFSQVENIKAQRAATGLAQQQFQFQQQQAQAEEQQLEKNRRTKQLTGELASNEKRLQNKDFAEMFPEQFDALVDRTNEITSVLMPGSRDLSGSEIRSNFDRWKKINKLDDYHVEEFGEGSPEHQAFLKSASLEFEGKQAEQIGERLEVAQQAEAQQALSSFAAGTIKAPAAIGRGASTEDIARLTAKTATVAKPDNRFFKDKKGRTLLRNINDPLVQKAQSTGELTAITPSKGKGGKAPQEKSMLIISPETGDVIDSFTLVDGKMSDATKKKLKDTGGIPINLSDVFRLLLKQEGGASIDFGDIAAGETAPTATERTDEQVLADPRFSNYAQGVVNRHAKAGKGKPEQATLITEFKKRFK